jgi:6-hydroxymethylpterin diphosphokinase MptE-like protein
LHAEKKLINLVIKYTFQLEKKTMLEHIKNALTYKFDTLHLQSERDVPLIIAAGGPSLISNLHYIKKQYDAGYQILAVNEVANFLLRNDIHPWAASHLGPISLTTQCIGQPNKDLIYYIASICPPDTFNLISESNVVLWHPYLNIGEKELITDNNNTIEPYFVNGGQTVTLRSLDIAYALGFRDIHLYGADSSSNKKEVHSYPSVSDVHGYNFFDVEFDGNWYTTTPELAGQAIDFPKVYQKLSMLDVNITVHGEGLIPMIWKYIVENTSVPPIRISSINETEPHGIKTAHTF